MLGMGEIEKHHRERKHHLVIQYQVVSLKTYIHVTLFTDDMIVYISNSKNFIRKIIQLINTFSKAEHTKLTHKISIIPIYTWQTY